MGLETARSRQVQFQVLKLKLNMTKMSSKEFGKRNTITIIRVKKLKKG